MPSRAIFEGALPLARGGLKSLSSGLSYLRSQAFPTSRFSLPVRLTQEGHLLAKQAKLREAPPFGLGKHKPADRAQIDSPETRSAEFLCLSVPGELLVNASAVWPFLGTC